MNKQMLTRLTAVAQAIYDKKGFNTLILDVRGISSMTDYMIIAEGSVERHVYAISQAIQEKLKGDGEYPLHVGGEKESDWIVIDYCDFIVHLFIPDLRERYAIEQLWKKSKIIDVAIDKSSPIQTKLQTFMD